MGWALRLLLIAGLSTACSGDGDGPSDKATDPWGDELTDTYPQFRGRVPKNLLMISFDTTRKDHFGRYDTKSNDMAFMSAVAEAGVIADNHTTCSNWTFAGVSCTLLGRYDWQAGHMTKLTASGQAPFPSGVPFLAGWLADAGFYSVLSSTNGWLGNEWGNTQGYNQAFHPRANYAYGAFRAGLAALDAASGSGKVDDRWFLHIHLIEPHVPYTPPDGYLTGLESLEPIPWDIGTKDDHYEVSRDIFPDLSPAEQALLLAHLDVRYRGELRYMDDQVRHMFSDLETRGMLDDTLVVFWNDHGEQFWEHGHQSHAYSLYREENDGLLFFWSKNIVPSVHTGPTSQIDLTPTLLSLYDIEMPAEVTGFPMGQAPEDRVRISTTISRLGATTSGRRLDKKLIFPWSGVPKLYDLTNDPLEVGDGSFDATDPEVVAMWAEMVPAVESAHSLTPEFSVTWPQSLGGPQP